MRDRTTSYHAIRDLLDSGYLMVLNRPGLIARHGRGTASHVGLLVWREADQSTLAVAESREGVGARVVTLSSQIRKFPGMIDIYRPIACPQVLRERAATIAFNWAGRAYDYPGILRRGLVHLPLAYELATRLGYDPDLTDTKVSPWDEPKVCSSLVAWAYRLARLELPAMPKWDPCPNLGDRWVEPADLVRSASFALHAKGLVIDE